MAVGGALAQREEAVAVGGALARCGAVTEGPEYA